MAKQDGTKVMTDEVRFSYTSVFTPRKKDNGDL